MTGVEGGGAMAASAKDCLNIRVVAISALPFLYANLNEFVVG